MSDTYLADKKLLDIMDLRNGMVTEDDPILRDIRVHQSLTRRNLIKIVGHYGEVPILGMTPEGVSYAESIKLALGN